MTQRNMYKRVILDLALLGVLFFLPWYCGVILAAILLVTFKHYWEVIIAGLILDALYSLSGVNIYTHFGLFTVIFSALFAVSEIIKPKLRFYS